ncbi:MAG: DUF1330 domain-containing protein [Alphaproteobacteria bacterium]|nr:DUF1330 domain-containing protein [Alphaproteobacteria bacterium]
MAKGYWVANVSVDNLAEYKKYVEANAVAFAKYGGKFLVRAGKHEVREGQMNNRIVVLEFKDYETALACYASPEYQDAMKFRTDHASANLAIVEGWDG